MARFVALLHSVVLGPGRRVVMADLRGMAERLGLGAPRTLVATGNLVFDAAGTDVAALEARLEAAFAEAFGRRVDIIVRDADAWRRLVARNPFPTASEEDGARVVVRVMRRPLPPETARTLDAHLDDERIAIVEGDLWMQFRRQPSASRLLGQLTPRRLGIGTARNWNTVRRLGEMLEEPPPASR
jgi:uncharacterized protein (DUF1697 family)